MCVWAPERLRNTVTNDSDCERTVGLVAGAVGRDVGDGLRSDGEQLRRCVHRFHLHRHLEEE